MADLLPQRPPFILVDRLIYYDPRKATTLFTVREDRFFCSGGRMQEAGLIENIAQTCAARTGYEQKMASCDDIKIGLIGMIKKMEISRSPRAGEQLETTIVVVEDVFSTSLIEAKVEIEGEVIATCEMKIVLTDVNAG
ncbi:MAG: pseudouridylate synthase [Tannerella sp.]|jgi:predicted hotdog family 3-hydroxylacyl-ACP dehydratase|nr:pseudouridylate synthase [Tannerella sp.]